MWTYFGESGEVVSIGSGVFLGGTRASGDSDFAPNVGWLGGVNTKDGFNDNPGGGGNCGAISTDGLPGIVGRTVGNTDCCPNLERIFGDKDDNIRFGLLRIAGSSVNIGVVFSLHIVAIRSYCLRNFSNSCSCRRCRQLRHAEA